MYPALEITTPEGEEKDHHWSRNENQTDKGKLENGFPVD